MTFNQKTLDELDIELLKENNSYRHMDNLNDQIDTLEEEKRNFLLGCNFFRLHMKYGETWWLW